MPLSSLYAFDSMSMNGANLIDRVPLLVSMKNLTHGGPPLALDPIS